MERLMIKYVPINDLKKWDKNPKKHNKEAIIESIKQFNPTQPILVQKGTNRIIAGHGRIDAFRELGYTEVPIIELSLNDKQAKAYALVDNQTTMVEGWDELLLKLDLDEIHLESPELDMDLLGFRDEPLGNFPNANDPVAEWKGMPEFDNENVSGRTIIMHFKTEEDVQSFARLIGQNISDRTKFIWYPPDERPSRFDNGYAEEYES